MKRKKVRLAVAFLAVVIIGGVLWCYLGAGPSDSSSDIFASGFIEARDVAIALEVGGRIVDITADEGDQIEAGVSLIRLDDSLLKAQQQQAKAAIEVAQARLEQIVVSRDQAVVSSDGAKKIWENALDVQANPLELEARIIAAQGEFDVAELNLEHVKKQPIVDWWVLRTATLRCDIARNALDNLLLIRENPQEISAAVDKAHAAYQNVEIAVAVAEKAVEVAEKQVAQAEASLEIINIQIGKLAVGSPIAGVVAALHAEVGEIAQPGVPILTVTELKEVTLTAYVPESKLGLVKLGQEAIVSVDSYPGESFAGKVVYISPRALFTPKNIQMKEEREKMVFAVKIKLANLEQKLKPSMPADARILVSSGE